MSGSISEQKRALRKNSRAARKALGREVRHAASLSICKHIAAWDHFRAARTVLTYLPMPAEVDLTALFPMFPEKRWIIPRISPDEIGQMTFHPYDPARLVRHPFGMLEPDPDLPLILPAEVQVVLAPGLAYDRSGWRLGYGGGYYDRFLARFAGSSLGVIFYDLLLDHIPHDDYDMPVHWLVSEQGLWQNRP